MCCLRVDCAAAASGLLEHGEMQDEVEAYAPRARAKEAELAAMAEATAYSMLGPTIITSFRAASPSVKSPTARCSSRLTTCASW